MAGEYRIWTVRVGNMYSIINGMSDIGQYSKIQVIAYKTTNHIPDNSRKKEQETNVPEQSNAVYIGGIKLEDE